MYRNAEKIAQSEQTIVQEYLDKTLLIDGFKCDMRIYVLMTSCDPLKLFLFDDGLIRMGTERYSSPNEGNIVISIFPTINNLFKIYSLKGKALYASYKLFCK